MRQRKLDKILANVEMAVRDLRPQDALADLELVEAAMASGDLRADEALRQRLSRLGGLVISVSQGVTAARTEIAQVLRHATTLQTYDAQGQLSAQSQRSRPVRRF